MEEKGEEVVYSGMVVLTTECPVGKRTSQVLVNLDGAPPIHGKYPD